MILVVLCITLAVLWLISLWMKNREKPPGPYGIPILGYYPFMGKAPFVKINELSMKYNDVMVINLLGEDYWFCNSPEAVEEAFHEKGEIFSGKPMDEFSLFNSLALNTVTLSEGDEWKRHTKVTASALSKFANKSTFEIKIQELVERTESLIADTKGKPHNFHLIIANLASNIILQFNCSRDYEITDYEFKRIRHTAWQLALAFDYLNFILTGPVFKLMMKFRPHYLKLAKDSWADLEEITESIARSRLRTWKPTDCNDALDSMIKEYRTPEDECDMIFVKKNLAGAIFSGIDTTAAIMNSSLKLMAVYRDIQEKVYQEICDTIGADRQFDFMDKERVPYTLATITEVHRFAMITGLTFHHVAREETTLRGYKVPNRTKVFANAFALSRNKNIFKNPFEFDPNNFLDENGHFQPNAVGMIPFGAGYRKCLGVKLSEVQLFVTFVRLMRRFEWSLPDGVTVTIPATMKGNCEFLVQQFDVCAKERS